MIKWRNNEIMSAVIVPFAQPVKLFCPGNNSDTTDGVLMRLCNTALLTLQNFIYFSLLSSEVTADDLSFELKQSVTKTSSLTFLAGSVIFLSHNKFQLNELLFGWLHKQPGAL